MKTPRQLSEKLARQWNSADLREQRLLMPENNWPLALPIGKPTAGALRQQLAQVRQHIQQWREVTQGEVVWNTVRYRDTEEPIEVPATWCLHKPSDWIAATGRHDIKQEYQTLAQIIRQVDALFHPTLIRQRHLTANKSPAEVIQACQLAMQLEAGCAHGLPLRALSLAGIDSKFFERHRTLIIKLLNLRFDGLISDIGLEAFLGALDENDHWLLVADLDGGLLPFEQIRIRDKEIRTTPLPGKNLLIVENERCLHLLPPCKETLVILGSGLNLRWMEGPWLAEKRIAYWGDIDTWGLRMLATAREYQPSLTPLLMSSEIFEHHGEGKAVQEPETAGETVPNTLTADEGALYQQLLQSQLGRLEQEFLPLSLVQKAVKDWHAGLDQ